MPGSHATAASLPAADSAGVVRLDVEQAKPKPVLTAPGPQPEFKSDLRVSYVSTQVQIGKVIYLFKVENIGIETSDPIELYGWRSYSGVPGGLATAGSPQPTIAPLATGQSTIVGVMCQPPGDASCTGGRLKAMTTNDPNFGNNVARIGSLS